MIASKCEGQSAQAPRASGYDILHWAEKCHGRLATAERKDREVELGSSDVGAVRDMQRACLRCGR
jgi:hypothetical protein